MITKITHLTLFVADQDKALSFYQKIGFIVHTDAQFGDMRWLTLCLPSQKDFELPLLLAVSPEEKALVGKQAASKPLFTVETDDCKRDYERLKQAGVELLSEPTEEPWGISVAFKDVDGNMIYMCQPS
jgi:catechol 2,3-dioxygenase-like lactoylglutathione lyase family enzyme